ncbi:MAG: PTS system mannose/fructose/N-acetylgalactosamine-transporter subunit IIB [Clostridium sp.]
MIIQIRVDDRLIHGQIAVVWSKHFATNHLVVANDQAAKNEVQQMTLKMATPNCVKVLIRSVDDAIKVFNNPKSNSVKMFVLTNSIQDALKIATSCKVESINVANVGRFEAASDKKQLNADVGCTPKELEALKEIAKLDMETIHWVIPTNPKISVKKLLENN